MKIVVNSKKCQYELNIHGKYSIIAGDSGTGKTTFYKMVMLWESGNAAIKVSCDHELHSVAINEGSHFLETHVGCVIVIDENCKLLKDPEIASILQKSNNYFILITRKEIDYLPISVDSYYSMSIKGTHHTNIAAYKRFKNRNYCGIRTIVTEDSRSGYLFMKEYYDCDIKSAHSKSQLTNFLVESGLSGEDVLAVYDAAAFAFQAKSFYKLCETCSIQVLDWESFEHEILLNYPFNINLTRDDCSYKFESLEQLATEVLSERIQYKKDSLSNCLKKNYKCNICRNKCEYAHSRSLMKTFTINQELQPVSIF